MAMQIRPMMDEDVPDVSKLLCDCFRWLAKRESFTAEQLDFLLDRASQETVRKESRTRTHLVAYENRMIAGLVVVNGDEIARLYVHPRLHRQGIGKMLFETAENLIRQSGFAEANVAALVDNAFRFYKAMGMTEIGRQVYEPQVFLGRKVILMNKAL